MKVFEEDVDFIWEKKFPDWIKPIWESDLKFTGNNSLKVIQSTPWLIRDVLKSKIFALCKSFEKY